MSEVGSAFIPSPGRCENRRFLARLRDWGCQIGKADSAGEAQVLCPNGDMIWVHSADNLLPTPERVCEDVLDSLALEWKQFWLADIWNWSPEELAEFAYTVRAAEAEGRECHLVSLVEGPVRREIARQQQAEQEAAARQERRERWARKAVERLARIKGESEMSTSAEEPGTAPEPTPSANSHAPKQKRTRIINRVFDLLVDSGEAMSTEKVAQALVDVSRPSVNAACLGLVKHGVVERLKPGVYRVKPEMLHQEVRVDVVASTQDQYDAKRNGTAPSKAQEAAESPEDPIPTRTTRVAVLAPPMPPQEAEEELIADVLDLLIPGGFKARHACVVQRWMEATRTLLEQVKD